MKRADAALESTPTRFWPQEMKPMTTVHHNQRIDQRTDQQRMRDEIHEHLYDRGIVPSRRNIRLIETEMHDQAGGTYIVPPKREYDDPLLDDIRNADGIPEPSFLNRSQVVQYLAEGNTACGDWGRAVDGIVGIDSRNGMHYEAVGDRLYIRHAKYYSALFNKEDDTLGHEAADCIAWAAIAWEPTSPAKLFTNLWPALADATDDMQSGERWGLPCDEEYLLGVAAPKVLRMWREVCR